MVQIWAIAYPFHLILFSSQAVIERNKVQSRDPLSMSRNVYRSEEKKEHRVQRVLQNVARLTGKGCFDKGPQL